MARKAVGPTDECISGSVITRVRHPERDQEISYVTNYSIVLSFNCSSLFSLFFPILSSLILLFIPDSCLLLFDSL
jgi:hypothetical protein